eukprot:1161536-Pelagomonas_calceolata.AAC.2
MSTVPAAWLAMRLPIQPFQPLQGALAMPKPVTDMSTQWATLAERAPTFLSVLGCAWMCMEKALPRIGYTHVWKKLAHPMSSAALQTRGPTCRSEIISSNLGRFVRSGCKHLQQAM